MSPMRRPRLAQCLLSLAMAGLPAVAGAHALHDGGTTLLSGAAHPFTGVDHLLVLLATGIWSTQGGAGIGRPIPAVFLAAMLAGLVLATPLQQSGWTGLAWLESGLAASVLVSGLLLAFALRLPLATGVPLVATMALLHGLAHGLESPVGPSGPWTVGVLGGSTLLLLAGRWLGSHAHGVTSRHALRIAGAASVCIGLILLT